MAKSTIEKMQDATGGLFEGMTPLDNSLENQSSSASDQPSSDHKDSSLPQSVPTVKKVPRDKSTQKKEPPLSVWLDQETRKKLKAMSQATGSSVSKLVTAAVNQYLEHKPLSSDQRIIYDAAIRLLNE